MKAFWSLVARAQEVTWLPFLLLALLLLGAYPFVRRLYRNYLTSTIFFEPWVNMSKDPRLDIGQGLAEILHFELEAIFDVYDRARRYEGLWNADRRAPQFERLREGQPLMLTQVESLGLSGKMGQVLRAFFAFVFRTPPPTLRGSIHRFGKGIRLQVTLEDPLDERGVRRRSRCWKTERADPEFESDTPPPAIPMMVSELAHKIYLELTWKDNFKSVEGFQYFTQALAHHLAFKSLNDLREQKEAIELYKKAIRAEGDSNASAAYNIGELLYFEYTREANDQAIEYFQRALKTNDVGLRALAFRGLANAFCQKCQRHKAADHSMISDALRLAKKAYELSQTQVANGKSPDVVKALAYAWHVQSEILREAATRSDALNRAALATSLSSSSADVGEATEALKEAEHACRQAIRFYQEAISLNRRFTIAQNNLGYLYRDLAEKEYEATRDVQRATEYLTDARRYFEQAIASDSTYPHSYDNLGNACLMLAKVEARENRARYLEEAETRYYEALDYNPKYDAARNDLARVQLWLAPERAVVHAGPVQARLSRAWHLHLEALSAVSAHEGKVREFCMRFVTDYLEVLPRLDDPGLSDELEGRLDKVGCACMARVRSQVAGHPDRSADRRA